jgi:hypothetical protein
MTEIATKLQSLDDLFDRFDPNPPPKRRLSDGVAGYLMACVQEAPSADPLVVTILLPEAMRCQEGEEALRAALPQHFERLAEVTTREINRIRTIGYVLLPIAFIIMCISVVASELLNAASERHILHSLSESLLVFGWVVLWAPLDFVIFRRLPLVRQRGFYKRLAGAEVRFQYT